MLPFFHSFAHHTEQYLNSIRKLLATMLVIVTVSVIFTAIQLLMDILNVYEPLVCKSHDLFTHGGMIFVFTSSTLFAIAYMSIFCLYVFELYKRWNLPSKKSFYRYALFLSIVNIFQAIGSMLWFYGTRHQQMGHVGICFTMLTSSIYLISFAPVVYWIFLSNYFRMTKSSPGDNANVNVAQGEGVTSRNYWWRWPLKPTQSIVVPIYKQHTYYEESSRLIDKSTPSSVENSYSSINSDDVPS